jgi:O-antigen/teichoic acid export membrane protein
VNLKPSFFYKNKFKFVLNIIILTAVFYGVSKIILIPGWLGLIVVAGICGIFGAIFNFFYYIKKEKRQGIYKKVKLK